MMISLFKIFITPSQSQLTKVNISLKKKNKTHGCQNSLLKTARNLENYMRVFPQNVLKNRLPVENY